MGKSLATVAILTLSAILVFAQQAMDNSSVIKLVKAGLSDDIIVSTINASPGTYDTSPDALIALKAAGASDKVVSAIVLKASGAAAAPRTNANGAQPATQVPTIQEPEVVGKIFFLDPAAHALKELPGEQWKRKNKAGWGSVQAINVVQGARSSFRISSSDKIAFVFRPFSDLQSGNIERMEIYPMEVKSGERACVVVVTKGRTQTGTSDVISLEAVKYGSSSYMLSPPNSHLSPGEYWISVPGADSLNDPMITFGVD